MPLYEYRCLDCDTRFEVLQALNEGPEGLLCIGCGKERVEKQYSTFASGRSKPSTSSTLGSGPASCSPGFC